MFKKVFFKSLFVFAFVLSWMSVECLADVAAQLEQATTYIEENQFEQATAIYESILSSQPDKKTEVLARGGLIVADIHRGKIETAETAVVKLINDYSDTITVSEAAFDIAQAFGSVGKWEKASELYQYILDTWPSSEDFAPAKTGVVKSNIMLGNIDEADSDVEKLISDLPEHERIIGGLRDIADCYRNAGKYNRARTLYRYILDNWPESEEVIFSQSGLASSYIALGESEAAEAAIEKLLAEFSGREETAGIVNEIGEQYFMLQKYERAIQLYQYALFTWPDSDVAIWSQSGVGASYAALGNDAAAKAAMEKLLTAFSGHPELPEAALQIAEPYWQKGLDLEKQGLVNEAKSNFQKALKIAEEVENRVPGYVPNADTYLWTAISYRVLGNYEKSTNLLQKLVDEWPNYGKASDALYLIGQNYDRLRDLGVITDSEADLNMKAAYELLVEKYPTSSEVSIVQIWLNRHDPNSQN